MSLSVISLVISAGALALSLYSVINTYYEKHIKTKVYLRWIHEAGKQLNICLLISNMSSRPSTITSIFFVNQDEKVESSWSPKELLSSFNPNDKSYKVAFTDSTPLNIPPRSARTFVVSFPYLRSNQVITDQMNFKFTIDEKSIQKTLHPKLILDSKQLSIALQNRMK